MTALHLALVGVALHSSKQRIYLVVATGWLHVQSKMRRPKVAASRGMNSDYFLCQTLKVFSYGYLSGLCEH